MEAVRATFHYGKINHRAYFIIFNILLKGKLWDSFTECSFLSVFPSRYCAFFQVPAHQELYARDNMEELSLNPPAHPVRGSDMVDKSLRFPIQRYLITSSTRMRTLQVVFLLYFTTCVTTNATTERVRAQKQAVAACQNLTSSVSDGENTTTTLSFPNASCWSTLDMANWMTTWNASTTICTATQEALTLCQCRLDEPWATCFMRLTYEGNRTASYLCMDLTKPKDCTMPVPGNVVAGPVEIFYGAFSIWCNSNQKFYSIRLSAQLTMPPHSTIQLPYKLVYLAHRIYRLTRHSCATVRRENKRTLRKRPPRGPHQRLRY